MAGEEVPEGLDVRSVGLLGGPRDLGDARAGASTDVVVQARAARPGSLVEEGVRARPDGEHPGARVEGLPDRVRVPERAEVPDVLALRAPEDLGPRPPLAHRQGEVRVGLVVAVPDVEPGLVLLDQVELEQQRVDLRRRQDPLDGGRGRDHGLGPRVEVAAPVVDEPLPQRPGLPDVDDPAVRVSEQVRARGVGDRRCHRAGEAHTVIVARRPARTGTHPRGGQEAVTVPFIVGWTSHWK